MTKTLWIFNQYAHAPHFPGGTRHVDLGSELVRRGYSVHIFAGGFHHLLLKEVVLGPAEGRKIEVINGVVFHWLRVRPYKQNGPSRLISMMLFYLSLLTEVKTYARETSYTKPDIIIGSSVHLFSVLAAQRTAKRLKSRFVMEVRDLWPYTFTATGQMSKYHPVVLLFGWMERFLYRRAETIISLMEHAHEYIGQHTASEKVVWLPNSFNSRNLKNADSECGIGTSIDCHKFTIMFVGSMNMLDNLLLLIRAFEKAIASCPDLQLVLIGGGMERQSLQNYVTTKGIDSVHIFDAIPKSAVQSCLRLADALWVGMPNSVLYRYGISFNKIYDYMASGKPILLSSADYDNPVTRARCGVIAKADDEDSLVDCILRLRTMDREEREQLGRNGYAYLMENFTTEIIAQQMVDRVLAREPAR